MCIYVSLKNLASFHYRTTSNLETLSHCGSDVGETAESILLTMGSTPASPSTVECSADLPLEQPSPPMTSPLAAAPNERPHEATPAQKKRKKMETFEEQLLGKLEKKMTENEAFGLSVGLSLDQMPRKMASKCKARIIQLIADMEEQMD